MEMRVAGQLGMAWVVVVDGLCGVQPSRSAWKALQGDGAARQSFGRPVIASIPGPFLETGNNGGPEAAIERDFTFALRVHYYIEYLIYLIVISYAAHVTSVTQVSNYVSRPGSEGYYHTSHVSGLDNHLSSLRLTSFPP